jgi:hypothetical protein
LFTPLVELVRLRSKLDVIGELICPTQGCTIVRVQGKRPTAAGYLGLTLPDDQISHIAIRINTETVDTIAQQIDGCIGGIHFEHLIAAEVVYTNVHISFSELQLHGAVVEVEKTKAGLRTDPHYGDIKMKLGCSALIRVQIIANSERSVNFGWCPFVYSRRFHRNIAVYIVETGHARWWVLLRGQVAAKKQQEKNRSENT